MACVYQVLGEDIKKVEYLFDNCKDTLIWSVLQGCMGSVWADSNISPKSAQVVIADFCFFAGEANMDLIKNKPLDFTSDFVIMVPQNDDWAELIERVYGEDSKKITRYAIKKELDIFDEEKLQQFVEHVNCQYEIKFIDEEIYYKTKTHTWSSDLCANFTDYEDYKNRGIGVAALYHGELVSGASSYTVYHGGIEIEIDTRQDHRRKGLALACGATLILGCIHNNLYPSWDAHNKGSVALAEKLGYHFDKEYVAYEIYGYTNMAVE